MEPTAPPIDPPLDVTRTPDRARPTPEQRIVALLEVALCSGFPTQLTLAVIFASLAFGPTGTGGTLQIRYVAPLLFADTVVLVGLILLFLRVHRERPTEVFFGGRQWGRELRAAVPMIFIAYGIALAVMVTVALVAPWLHTVERNPLQDLLSAPGDAALFALVVVVAGGVREEIQRAFILRRFERWLGGATLGVVISSVAFGAGHLVQGADAAIATGLLGAFWGVSYLRRRSIVAPIISHAAFDLLQILVFLSTGR